MQDVSGCVWLKAGSRWPGLPCVAQLWSPGRGNINTVSPLSAFLQQQTTDALLDEKKNCSCTSEKHRVAARVKDHVTWKQDFHDADVVAH